MKQLKLQIKLVRIKLKDVLSNSKFSKKRKNTIVFENEVAVSQEIKPSETFENKVYNLNLASEKINEYTILPGEIFSFWRVVGNPYDFKESRSISNGKIINEVGGGICQVSGIVHFASIISGLEIIERHNHSVDLYTEDTRFAPLGTDATVVYGNKDLRIRNNFNFPIQFKLEIHENRISVKILSPEKIEQKELMYEMLTSENNETIVNVSTKDGTFVNRSIYRKLL